MCRDAKVSQPRTSVVTCDTIDSFGMASSANNSNSASRSSMVPDRGAEKRSSKFNARVNQMTPSQVTEELTKRQLPTRGVLDVQRARLKRHPDGQVTDRIEQKFDYIAVVDFEATCQEASYGPFQNEIIEFPVVVIDVRERRIIDQFRSYCRPEINPVLTPFCTQLTGIQQHQVDAAPVFFDVLHNVETWLKDRDLLNTNTPHRLAFATDGPWDFAKFLRRQCQLNGIPYPRWAKQWIDIRQAFASFYSVRRCGVSAMLQSVGLTFDGQPHSGLDDSINIARIALELIEDRCVLRYNDRLPDDGSIMSEV